MLADASNAMFIFYKACMPFARAHLPIDAAAAATLLFYGARLLETV